MRTMVITSYGGPSNFAMQNWEIPEIADGELLISNHASSVNPVDVMVRSGKARPLSGIFTPKQIGGDFAGRVVRSNHSKWKVGDEVFGMVSPLKGGAYSEFVKVHGDNVGRRPDNLTILEAGVLTIAWLTAYQALIDFGQLKPGEEVFINGCSGGVGSAAIQMAKAIGANVVGTCSKASFDFAKAQGADEVYDYETLDFKELQGQFHHVFDAAAKLDWEVMEKLGRPEAHYSTTRPNATFVLHSLISKKMKLLNCSQIRDKLPKMSAMMEKHGLRPHIEKRFDLADVGKAHRYFENSSVQGKVMIEIK